VTRDWERFFDPATPLKERTALLEDGEQLRLLVRAFGRDPRAKRVRARVRSVRFASSTQAEVRYALSLEGRTVLRDAPGMAVLRDGVWKVSFRTVCELVRLDGGPPEDPAC
jgi:translation initiation factor IF-3